MPKAKKEVVASKKLPRTIVVSKKQKGKSDSRTDKMRTAMPPGKRISKSGNEYYENRKNRSDMPGKRV